MNQRQSLALAITYFYAGAGFAAGTIGITPASAPGMLRLFAVLGAAVAIGWWVGFGKVLKTS